MADAYGRFQDGAHILPLRVYWEDTDAAGIVYYANYLRYTERARSDMLRAAGVGQTALREKDGIVFAVRNCEVEYLKPARLDDEIEVHTSLTDIGGATVSADQTVKRGGDDLVRTSIRLACVNKDGRPQRLPPNVRHILQTLPNATGD
ncbi:MAG: tol-pal system-associated acyl-CoA thioesterase [Minwuiales bacterium]|nr:tol-pal system-associated acyl-CoA thioesterase [Minwuiales bacterium]